jgi:hypothetical protein
MEFEAILLLILCGMSIVLGPIVGAESRPAFLRPDRKYRWFV